MTGRRGLPDPVTGRWLRALAIGLTIACAVTCARSSDAPARRVVSAGGPVDLPVHPLDQLADQLREGAAR